MTGQSYSAATTRAWIEVDLGALVRNAATLARRAGVPLLPMVKADAYGLGAVAVARALLPLSPWGFGVATVAEGAELRAAGITLPIVVFTPVLREDWPALRAARLTPALHRSADIRAWADGGGAPWQLDVDTGMDRAGAPWNRVGELDAVLRAAPPEGAFTHFHSAEREDGTRERQEERFRVALAAMPVRPPLVHAENSAGLEHGGPSSYDLVRPGVFLYGVDSGGTLGVSPVAAMRARVVDLREIADGETVSYGASWRAHGRRRIATLAVGYADGYRRSLSNRGTVLLHGRPAPVAGLVTMDMTMVDVTDLRCEIGDVATLLGTDGAETLTVPGVARTAEMSPYELLTGLRGRLPHLYRAPLPADHVRGLTLAREPGPAPEPRP
jgi:alanine racemase